MNISNIQQYLSVGSFAPKPGNDVLDAIPMNAKKAKVEDEVVIQEVKLLGSEKSTPDSRDKEKNWEDLVMKPSPISLEERMAQVISAEQVKDLLSLVTRMPLKEEEHNLDVKR